LRATTILRCRFVWVRELSTHESFHVQNDAHPGVNTALPVTNTCWQLRRTCGRPALGYSCRSKNICAAGCAQAFRGRSRVSGQLVERGDESSTEGCNLCEGVGFAACVLQQGRLSRREVNCRQLKRPSGGIQQGIEAPRAGDVIGLQLRNEEV